MSESTYHLIESIDHLRELTQPILDGEVTEWALDTETTLVRNGYFTTYGTDLRAAGFSISYGDVDLYCPVRHVAYDWRRRTDLIKNDLANDGPAWVQRLLIEEGVIPEGEEGAGEFRKGFDPNVSPRLAFEHLNRLLWASQVPIFLHNVAFDARIMEREGLLLPWGRLWDTQALAVFCDTRPLDVWLDEEKRFLHGGYSLKHLGEAHLNIPADAQALLQQAKQALGKGSSKLEDYSMLPLRSAIAPYAAMDTRLTLSLATYFRNSEAFARPAVQKLLEEHREELPIIVAMEREGLRVNAELAAERATEKRDERTALIQKMKKLAGRDVPVDSPTRLREILYGELQIPRHRGNDDTRDATLKHVRTKMIADGMTKLPSGKDVDDMVKLVDAIRDYRSVDKEIGSFYDPLSKATSGVVHPIIRQLGAKTTRQTAEKPNAHQAKKPKKGEDPTKSVRHLILPRPGHVLICADYSAEEMRAAAHYAVAIPDSFPYRFTWRCTLAKRGDCKGKAPHGVGEVHTGWRDNYSEAPREFFLRDGFIREGASFDPHTKMVDIVAEKGYDVERGKCKNGNFAIIYGVGGPKLSDMLDVPVSTAYKLIRMFWDDVYPELGRVKLFISERLRKHGPESVWSHQTSVNTLHGAPIYLDDGYKGMNYIIQRSCREILLKATVACERYITENGIGENYRIALTVHDEIIFEVREEALEEHHVRALCRLMVEAGARCCVPMVVEPKIARESWALKEDLPASWGFNGVTDVEEEEVTS